MILVTWEKFSKHENAEEKIAGNYEDQQLPVMRLTRESNCRELLMSRQLLEKYAKKKILYIFLVHENALDRVID